MDANGDVFFTDGNEALEEVGVRHLSSVREEDHIPPGGLAVSADGSTVTGITELGGTGYGSIWQWTIKGETDLYQFPASKTGLNSPTTQVTFDGMGNAFRRNPTERQQQQHFRHVYEVQLGTQNPPTVLHQFTGFNDGQWPERSGDLGRGRQCLWDR